MDKPEAKPGLSATALISKRIADLGDWRGETLGTMRALVTEADPDGSLSGILCTGESYKDKIKLTFAKGASLKDPSRLFNASLDGNVRRAIDIHEGETVDATAFLALVREAVALNRAGKSKPSKNAKS
jgi:hypothetical protein